MDIINMKDTKQFYILFCCLLHTLVQGQEVPVFTPSPDVTNTPPPAPPVTTMTPEQTPSPYMSPPPPPSDGPQTPLVCTPATTPEPTTPEPTAPPSTPPPPPAPYLMRLINDLLAEERYRPYILPTLHPTRGVRVNVSFTLTKVQGLDERSQTLTSLGFLDLEWYDELLTWNPAVYNDVRALVLHPDQIWLPEILVMNSVLQPEDIALAETMRFRAHITYQGRVTWKPAQRWETFCNPEMSLFPFDSQTCTVQIGNLVNQQGSKVDLQLKTTKVHLPLGVEDATTGSWKLLSTVASRDTQDLDPSALQWYRRPVLTMSLRLERVSEFYIYNVILPIVIITQVSMFAYLLPAASGEKIGFTITILLTYFVLLLMVSELMPKAGREAPYITSYITFCMFMNSFSLIITVVILNFYHHHPYSRVPYYLRAFVFKCCGRMLCCSVPSKPGPTVGVKRKTMIDHRTITLEVDGATTGAAAESSDFHRHNGGKQLSDNGSLRLPTPGAGPTIIVEEEDDEKLIYERNQEEWMQLATVLDRLLFICGFVAVTLATAVYFLVVKVVSLTYSELLGALARSFSNDES